MRTTLKSWRKDAGFTMVELAVILVIIGLIMSAVSIGKDLQRDAETQKIKQKFIDQWVQSYNQFYSRTGVVLGDDQTEPRYMVGGVEISYAVNGGVGVQGVRNSALNGGAGNGVPFRICQGQGYLNDTFDRARSIELDLFTLMDRQGIRMSPGRSEGREDRYTYLDTNGNPQEIQVCFQWNEDSRVDGSGNMMVLRGLTPDLARELDYMIDGKPDAIEGMFRQQNPFPNTTTTNGIAGVEWAANNTFSTHEAQAASADETGRNLDEDQVVIVTAMYKMNQ